jgi:hypothetical protein
MSGHGPRNAAERHGAASALQARSNKGRISRHFTDSSGGFNQFRVSTGLTIGGSACQLRKR